MTALQSRHPMQANFSQERVRDMVQRWMPSYEPARPYRIHTDTTDFFRVEYDDILLLEDIPFLVRHNAREGRFGLDDEVKFWVKRALDLTSGRLKIVKLVFYEKFTAQIGGIAFECFRSPKKEARILALVAGHPNFMHGFTVTDEKENIIRVIDYIYGPTLFAHVESLRCSHERYFYDHFPGLLDGLLECIGALHFLHDHGEKHGDIRRDHILIDRESGRFRWIDFDYNYRHRENIYGYDLFGIGNILIFLVGQGDVTLPMLHSQNHPVLSELSRADMNIVFHNRLANLKKVFSYIPTALNRVLMHFSNGANWFYENTSQLLEDLGECRSRLE